MNCADQTRRRARPRPRRSACPGLGCGALRDHSNHCCPAPASPAAPTTPTLPPSKEAAQTTRRICSNQVVGKTRGSNQGRHRPVARGRFSAPHGTRGPIQEKIALARQYAALDSTRAARAVAASSIPALRALCLHGAPRQRARGVTPSGTGLRYACARPRPGRAPYWARALNGAAGRMASRSTLAAPALATHTPGCSGAPVSPLLRGMQARGSNAESAHRLIHSSPIYSPQFLRD